MECTTEQCSSYGSCSDMRRFLTRDEKVELLKEYKTALEKETAGVSERITDLEKEQ